MIDVSGKNVFLAVSPYEPTRSHEVAAWIKGLGASHVYEPCEASVGVESRRTAVMRVIHALTQMREDGTPAYDVLLHGYESGMNPIERYATDTAKVCGIPTYDISADFERWKCTR